MGSDISVAGALYAIGDGTLRAANSTVVVQVAAHGDDLLMGICAFAAGVLLYRLFRSFLPRAAVNLFHPLGTGLLVTA
ncbi:hypothetical protein ACQP10_20900 [Streptosporangium sandarakinum]|uniref:hypothetical protein n=1 Tax=Streptosporangium sandarakinum TaxID=1260955 RepID=UPI003D8F353F